MRGVIYNKPEQIAKRFVQAFFVAIVLSLRPNLGRNALCNRLKHTLFFILWFAAASPTIYPLIWLPTVRTTRSTCPQ